MIMMLGHYQMVVKTSQVARSAWKERLKALENMRIMMVSEGQ
jgi:hypothetical protein